MNFRKDRVKGRSDVNITPMLDMVFILLIFFAVSTTFVVNQSIDVNLPEAKSASERDEDESINIIVTNENVIKIDDKIITLSDLDSVLSSKKTEFPNALIVIEGDRDALHGIIISVIDSAKIAGFDKFAIATEEKQE